MSDEPTPADDLTPFEAAVADILRSLAPGEVVTYGEVALEAGFPGAARAVGNFLDRQGAVYPWWRVVRASGELASRQPREQAARLRAEGIRVTDGRVVLSEKC